MILSLEILMAHATCYYICVQSIIGMNIFIYAYQINMYFISYNLIESISFVCAHHKTIYSY